MNLDQINEQNKYNKFSTRFYSDCQTKRVDFFQPTFKELGDKNENFHQQPGISFFSNHFKYILNRLHTHSATRIPTFRGIHFEKGNPTFQSLKSRLGERTG